MIEKKYSLENFPYLIGDRNAKLRLKELISSDFEKPIILIGPPGSGKSSSVRFFASKESFRIINSPILMQSLSQSLDRKKPLTLIYPDQFNDKSFDDSRSLVLIADRREDVPNRFLEKSEIIEFKGICKKDAMDFLNLIISREQIKDINKIDRIRIISQARGNIRKLFFMIDLFKMGIDPRFLSIEKTSKKNFFNLKSGILKSDFTEFEKKRDFLLFLDSLYSRFQFSFFNFLKRG